MVSYNGGQPIQLPSQVWQTVWPNKSMVVDTDGLTEQELNELGYATIVFENSVLEGHYIIGYELVSGNIWRYITAAAPVLPAIKQITRLQFLNRFTDTELDTIYTAAKTNVSLEVMLDKFRAAEYIDLNDTQTIDGINILEAIGLISTGRAQVILS